MSGLYDPATGLALSDLLDDRIAQCAARARRHGEKAALMLINVNLGAPADARVPDKDARTVAETLRARLRGTDTAARLGEAVFAVVQTDIVQFEDAAILAGKLLDGLERLGRAAAIGIDIFPGADDAPGWLRGRAASALKDAAAEGAGTFRFHSAAMTQAAAPHVRLARAMPGALARGEFELHFQPKVALDGGAVTGAEALMRWHRADGDDVGPETFVPVAEQSGYIRQLGSWALHAACREASAWPDVPVAVNVSPMQLEEEGFLGTVRAALEDAGLAPERLELEITESALVADPDATAALLGRIGALGIHVTVDDFGTGRASLAYLSRFPVDKLKLDRSFVVDMDTNATHDQIVRAVIGLGHALGLGIVAEGVDRDAQRAMLLTDGCDEAQGYLFGAPMPAKDFAEMLAKA